MQDLIAIIYNNKEEYYQALLKVTKSDRLAFLCEHNRSDLIEHMYDLTIMLRALPVEDRFKFLSYLGIDFLKGKLTNMLEFQMNILQQLPVGQRLGFFHEFGKEFLITQGFNNLQEIVWAMLQNASSETRLNFCKWLGINFIKKYILDLDDICLLLGHLHTEEALRLIILLDLDYVKSKINNFQEALNFFEIAPLKYKRLILDSLGIEFIVNYIKTYEDWKQMLLVFPLKDRAILVKHMPDNFILKNIIEISQLLEILKILSENGRVILMEQFTEEDLANQILTYVKYSIVSNSFVALNRDLFKGFIYLDEKVAYGINQVMSSIDKLLPSPHKETLVKAYQEIFVSKSAKKPSLTP